MEKITILIPVYNERNNLLEILKKVESLDFEMEKVPIEDIYNKKLEFKYTPKKDRWGEILVKGASTYVEELDTFYEVEALDGYKIRHLIDGELGYCPSRGERWYVTHERLEILLENNLVKVVGKKTRKEMNEGEQQSI